MTPDSKREYTEIMRGRYLKADKKEKGKILDEFIKVTGYHRKAVIRVLLKKGSPGLAREDGQESIVLCSSPSNLFGKLATGYVPGA